MQELLVSASREGALKASSSRAMDVVECDRLTGLVMLLVPD